MDLDSMIERLARCEISGRQFQLVHAVMCIDSDRVRDLLQAMGRNDNNAAHNAVNRDLVVLIHRRILLRDRDRKLSVNKNVEEWVVKR